MSALSILILFLLVSCRFEKPVRIAFTAGLLLALTLLTKSTASFLLPAALLAIILSPYDILTKVKLAGILRLAVIFIVGSYYLAFPETRQAFIYNSTHVTMNPELTNLPYLLSLLEPFRDMFWNRFGWAGVRVPPAWIWVGTVFCLVGISTSAVVSIMRLKGSQLSATGRKQIWFLLAVILANISLIIYYNLFITQPQGRFLFPSMLALTLLTFWGYFQLLNLVKGRTRTALQWSMPVATVLFLCAFNYVALFQSIIPVHYLL